MQEIVQIISSVGFPIFACCAMFMYIKDREERHDEELMYLKDAISNNTLALEKLSERIEKEK